MLSMFPINTLLSISTVDAAGMVVSEEGPSPSRRVKGISHKDPVMRYESAMAQLESRLLQSQNDPGVNLLAQGMHRGILSSE